MSKFQTSLAVISVTVQLCIQVFWVISLQFNSRNTLPKSRTFLLGHPVYIYSTNIPPIMIINRIHENKNFLSLQLVSFLVGLKTYQHACITFKHPYNIVSQTIILQLWCRNNFSCCDRLVLQGCHIRWLQAVHALQIVL